MTEQNRFEAYANTQGYSIEKDDQGLYRSVETFCHWGTWQAAIESRKPAKDVDIEALKRGQENAEKIWTAEAVAELLGTAKEMK
jgi:hypothetical protein